MTNINDIVQISFEIDKKFNQQKLKQIRKYIISPSIHGYIDDLQYYSYFYGVLLQQYGWIILSLKHLNQLIYRKSINSKSSQPSVNQSIFAGNSFSATIRNDSSSQTLTDPSKKLAEVSLKNTNSIQKHQIQNSIKFDFFQIIKIKYFLNVNKTKLKNLFGSSQLNGEQHEISEQIQTFITQQLKMDSYLYEIIKIFKSKIKYYESLILLKQDSQIQKQMKLIQKICQKQLLFQLQLQLEYENYPSKKLLCLQIFYEAEVIQNYIQAFKLVHQSSLSDERFTFTNQNFRINFYSNEISYILVTIDDDLQTIELLQSSSNFKRLINQNLDEQLQFYHFLLPFIIHEHPLLVARFFKNGQSKYYKSFNLTFIKDKFGVAKPIIFSFDNVTSFQSDKLVIVGLIQEIITQSPYMMIDVNLIVGGITKDFLYHLGYSQSVIDQIQDFNIFYTLKIIQIFPHFQEWIDDSKNVDSIKLFQVDTYFVDLELLNQILLEENPDNFQKQTSIHNSVWSNSNFLKTYSSNITIQKQELYGYHYFIISFDSITTHYSTNQELSNQLQQFKTTYRSSKKTESFEVSQLDLSLDEALPKSINLFTIKSREGYSPTQNNNDNNNNNNNNHNSNNFHIINILQAPKDLYHEDFYKIDQLQAILSPNKSTSQLMEGSVKQKEPLCQQQDYFQNQQSKQHIHINGNLSGDQVIQHQTKRSTEYGFNNGELHKKYELLNKIISDKKPLLLKQIMVTITLLVLIQLICPIIVLIILNDDILKFISDIEIISLHASIQGPHDLFFSMRNTITAYQQMSREGFLTSKLVATLVEPYYQHVGLGYTELRDSFYLQLNNDYLKHFLDDESMVLMYMKDNDTQIYSFNSETFRECLLIILQYQFAQMRTFQKRQSTAGQPYQVFLFANYYNIQDKLEEITNSILNYSKNRSLNVGSKWITIWLIFIFVVMIVSLTLIYEFNLYLKQYDKFLQLMNYIDKTKSQFEIENLQQIIKQIINDQEFVFSYKFDIQNIEIQMQKSILQEEEQKIRKHQRDEINKRLPRLNYILCWTFICILFLTYALTITLKTNDYLSKYDDTADFYFMIQQLKFRSGSMFLYKEHFFRWSNFTYLTNYDKQRLYLLVDKALNNINNYLEFTNSFERSPYLISDSFADFFTYQETHNLCELIDPTYQEWMELYCEKAFEGQILKGSISVLNYMSNSIKNQQAINNFTKRVEVQLYELEGSQIVLRAFFKVSEQFQEGLKTITEQQNTFVLGITLVFILYLIIFLIFFILCLHNILTNEYAILRRIVFLIPCKIIFTDDAFERQLRQIALTQGLL